MQNNQLLQFLERCSKQELVRFRDFVHSPYFNKHQKTRELLDYIYGVRNWKGSGLERHNVFARLFPNQPYQEQKVFTLFSNLIKLHRQFIAQQSRPTNNDSLQQRMAIMQYASSQNLPKLFDWADKRLFAELENSKIRDHNYYRNQYQYWRIQDNFDLHHGSRKQGNHLHRALENLDIFLLAEKFKIACQMLARQQVTGQQYTPKILPFLVDYIHQEADYFQQHPCLWLYFLSYRLLVDGKESDYYLLKEQLAGQWGLLATEDARDLYTIAVNFCVRGINLGQEKYRKETFEIYQEMLATGLLYINKQLPEWDYTNIVSLGCRLKAFEWTEQFIYAEKAKLPPAQRENAFCYNLAALHYSSGAHEKALEALRNVVFSDLYYNLLSRILQLKIYYDTSQWEPLDYHLETFRIFLLRHRNIESTRRKSGQLFLRFTRRLLRFRESESSLSVQERTRKTAALKKDIIAATVLLNRQWLLDRVV